MRHIILRQGRKLTGHADQGNIPPRLEFINPRCVVYNSERFRVIQWSQLVWSTPHSGATVLRHYYGQGHKARERAKNPVGRLVKQDNFSRLDG